MVMNRFGLMIALAGVLAWAGAAADGDTPAAIAADAMIGWDRVEFGGATSYRLVEAPASGAAHAAVLAECTSASASGRILQRRIDLTATPVLDWRWRVDQGFSGVDERTRAGDDHAARIYLVQERWPRWRSLVVNYVFSSAQPAGAAWPNPYSSRFAMLAVAGRDAQTGQWRTERRNVREDFRRLHGIDLDHIDAIAIMTDCDNTGQSARAAYGPIRWLPEGNPVQHRLDPGGEVGR